LGNIPLARILVAKRLKLANHATTIFAKSMGEIVFLVMNQFAQRIVGNAYMVCIPLMSAFAPTVLLKALKKKLFALYVKKHVICARETFLMN